MAVSPDEVLAVTAERGLFEEPGDELVILDGVDILLLQGSLPAPVFHGGFPIQAHQAIVVGARKDGWLEHGRQRACAHASSFRDSSPHGLKQAVGSRHPGQLGLPPTMELPELKVSKLDYIETLTGNKVCKQSHVYASQNIVLTGKNIIMEDSIVRADLANIRTGRYCILSKAAVIRPPFKKFSKGGAFFPMHIGDHVFIGENAVVSAATIGSYVYIGKNCVIGRRSVLKDCCMIEDNTYIPPETTVPSFSMYSGNPGKQTGEVAECMEHMMVDFTKSFYRCFKLDPDVPPVFTITPPKTKS
ncbi:unnamed protein product [Darwinula stevensoni]|uniref:Dynactin subunit 5 n=1 Tax=Darwinula stevensoni TaxID=69355 RepID=A0A7R8X7N5_9CRUS|nr:unnamed protein product [Darwinula stevensoni]CAG0880713.1 unnamed protein product [Darwinula stevensoni]